MITKRITTESILKKLREKVANHQPIMISSAGSGLVASLLEKSGTDCINTFSGARLRSNGMGTMSMMWPILDSNQQTLNYTREDIMPALELVSDGITVNAIHPDAVFDTKLWTQEALEKSSKRYGITVEEYKKRNLLGAEITSRDVALAVGAFVDGTLSKSTGVQLSVDGGKDRVI